MGKMNAKCSWSMGEKGELEGRSFVASLIYGWLSSRLKYSHLSRNGLFSPKELLKSCCQSRGGYGYSIAFKILETRREGCLLELLRNHYTKEAKFRCTEFS